jgi:hypothetical protein
MRVLDAFGGGWLCRSRLRGRRAPSALPSAFGWGKALTPRVWPPVRERVVLPKAALSPPRPVGAHDPFADAVVLGDEIEGDPGTDSLFGKMVFNPFVRPAVLRCNGLGLAKAQLRAKAAGTENGLDETLNP